MNEVNKTIAENLIKLRKKNKLTQMEFAKKINYSDKSVSKWENGESCPSIAVACEIAEFYGITLNDLVNENLSMEEFRAKPHNYSHLVISLLACTVVWLLATIVFVYGTLFSIRRVWMSFIYAVPLTCITALVFNSLWGIKKVNYIILSVLNWTLLATIYLSFLKYNVWAIFFIGIIVQIMIALWSKLKTKTF